MQPCDYGFGKRYQLISSLVDILVNQSNEDSRDIYIPSKPNTSSKIPTFRTDRKPKRTYPAEQIVKIKNVV